ncbi:ABC transporter ATP-binding protein [Vibrio variabilis]|uniref:ABC transporter ATP-binding protein n=1 Tax=Vibrio variabilis TaxID=990271 RepID=UPI000DD51DD1|nr:sn-glycerol-3-phosphate ABC transporter ATP-binding protein UgpC [Vibrio variabilis]
MASVQLRNLIKNYGDTEVVKGINLDIQHGEFIVLLGPSGCGKSTTLRMLAGLEDITDGEICIEHEVINDLHPIERNIAMVFQSYALYPHMTVEENMAFALENLGVDKKTRKRMVAEIAEVLELTPLLDRKPKELSGGQRQRVAMGRAMVRSPDVFLFDEPLSNLDAKLRGQMRSEIKRLHQRIKTTVVYVTHDQVEAMTLADRIAILNGGVIEQIGTPKEIYGRPKNKFVAKFIGTPEMNVLENLGDDVTPFLATSIAQQVPDFNVLSIGIRAQDFHLNACELESDSIGSIKVTLEQVELMGSVKHLTCLFSDQRIVAEVPYRDERTPNEFELYFDINKVHVFDEKDRLITQ